VKPSGRDTAPGWPLSGILHKEIAMVNTRIKSTAKIVKGNIKEAANSNSHSRREAEGAVEQQSSAQHPYSPAQPDARDARQRNAKL